MHPLSIILKGIYGVGMKREFGLNILLMCGCLLLVELEIICVYQSVLFILGESPKIMKERWIMDGQIALTKTRQLFFSFLP